MLYAKSTICRSAAVLTVAIVIFLAVVQRVFALATEHFGNEPVAWSFAQEVLAVANLKSRVYWYEVNGDPHFFYRGNTEALNEALAKFAALKSDVREVILLPGATERKNLTREKTIPYDWEFHDPGGFYAGRARQEKGTRVMTRHPTMIIHVSVVPPAGPVDDKQVARWITDLSSDTFAVRQNATRQLEKVGHGAGPALRKAREGQPNLESRRRIEQLLDRLQGIDLDLLQIPAGVTVLDFTDLRGRYLKGLKSEDAFIRGYAAGSLGGLERYDPDVLPVLLEVLKAERHEYTLRCVAGALGGLGKKAEAALPMLKQRLDDPDINVRNCFQQTVQLIEKPTPETVNEQQAKGRAAIQKRISEVRKAATLG
jgi:hypothetical protein